MASAREVQNSFCTNLVVYECAGICNGAPSGCSSKGFSRRLISDISLPTVFILVDSKTKRGYSAYCFEVTVHQILVVIYTLY